MASSSQTETDKVNTETSETASGVHGDTNNSVSPEDGSTSPGKRDEEPVDAEDVCSRLENMELTEEETEELLKEALEINKKLKAELKRHDDSARRVRSRSRTTPTGATARPGSSTSVTLPPIPLEGLTTEQARIYGARLRPHNSGRIPQRVLVTSGRPRESVTASASVVGNRRSSAMTSRVTQSADVKKFARHPAKSKQPQWNDRFSYT